jgi:adenosylcobyric acid synthase
MIHERTGKPVIGVLPYMHDIGLPEEDGLALTRSAELRVRSAEGKTVKIVIVRLKYISNFTDFDPLALEPDVEVVYSENPLEIENADLVILPGSKNTVTDLLLLKEKHLDRSIRRAYEKGAQIIGICGGYQMLGKRIDDPHGVESRHKSIDGIGLLNIETLFAKEKKTCLVEAEIKDSSEFGVHPALAPALVNAGHRRSAEWNNKEILKGYEIHMGTSTGDIGLFRVKRVSYNSEPGTLNSELVSDGSMNKNCWGTYIHGIFENDSFRQGIINDIRIKKGLPTSDTIVRYGESQEKALDRLAAMVREHIDMDFVRKIVGI